MNKKRVFICVISEESNNFNPVLRTLSDFYTVSAEVARWDPVKAVRDYLTKVEDMECIYGTNMTANSGGPLTAEAVDYFVGDTLSRIAEAGKLDGVILILHGATVSEGCDDLCGYICEKIRDTVGEDAVMSAAFDLHANITEKVVKNLDYVCGFLEYPHIDRYETGLRAARLLCDHLFGKKRKMARAAVPMIAPAHAYNTTSGAFEKLKERAKAMVAEGKIVDYTVFQVQPWLDNPLVESAVIVIADDADTAIEVADALARENFEIRAELQGEPLYTVSEIIEKALANKSGKPIILVDSADSIGAGSTGDSAYVLSELLPYADKIRAAVAIRDLPAVEKAFEAGVGSAIELSLGATIAPSLSNPVSLTARVRSLHDGWFYLHGPLQKGSRVFSGRTAVLEVGKLLIRVSVAASNANDLNYYESFGISVENCDLVSVKACTSFRACYDGAASEIYNARTPGAACPVLFDLPYKKLPVPTYPFNEITEEDIRPAKCYRG